jgi:hypothetical protein
MRRRYLSKVTMREWQPCAARATSRLALANKAGVANLAACENANGFIREFAHVAA